MDLASIRTEYKLQQLSESTMESSLFGQFQKWFSEALKAEIPEPNAMVLSTCNEQGRPSGRVVLLKDVDQEGFAFYTNYNSRKGKELKARSMASLTFFWPQLERQVRIEGTVEKVSEQESLTYFSSRPWESRVGAWVSQQSEEIESRHVLESLFAELNEKFLKEGGVPKPPHWGGYRLKPDFAEFWQGRPGRLHDRICFEKGADGWRIFRVAP